MARLTHVGRDEPAGLGSAGWVERPFDDDPAWIGGPGDVGATGRVPGDGAVGRGRHVVGTPATGHAWRLTGVPVLLAAVVLVIAAVLLLRGWVGDGGGESLLPSGPLASAAPSVAAAGPVGDLPQDGALTGSGSAASAGTPSPSPAASASDGGPSVATGPVLVHVDGAVARPGVVTVPAGSRAADAVAAAGGATDDADTRLVNLARPVTDGELLVVPREGELPGPAPDGGAAPGTGGVAGGGGAAAGDADTGVGAGPAGAAGGAGPIDLNTADETVLDSLPGIGPVLATRIVEHRSTIGPFMSVDDLTSVSGIGPAVMADVRDLVTV